MSSTAIDCFYASAPAGEILYSTVEFASPAFEGGAIRVVRGYEDITVLLEDGSEAEFQASGIEIALPKTDNSGSQSLKFGLDNVHGTVQQAVDAANDAGEQVTVTYRSYLSSDLTTPAEPPIRMPLKKVSMEGATVNITAAYADIIGWAWPRRRYTTSFAPGLTYLT
ncbi:DUF1833 family protein [Kushneria phosphatilytica]|uniref:DUF1833 domain-containing protein n=1 Tax=Kushneria phosphatilytica TaxID=657387 RepID=A0A1S1NYQ2_9GAMM|nr:DUF1833 family protein [Kushneria phosphatilytica]OHV13017.1 hypothetical protein BH688_03165 [Kushneria phosphatilytica]QEL10888.1 DUF1833 domain-containing protein [Kushneria phosphatilytica]